MEHPVVGDPRSNDRARGDLVDDDPAGRSVGGVTNDGSQPSARRPTRTQLGGRDAAQPYVESLGLGLDTKALVVEAFAVVVDVVAQQAASR